jgi:hypothetical protein
MSSHQRSEVLAAGQASRRRRLLNQARPNGAKRVRAISYFPLKK